MEKTLAQNWSVHYPHSSVRTWIGWPATTEEVLQGYPGAVSAELDTPPETDTPARPQTDAETTVPSIPGLEEK